ncbi:MAG: hypothetical protein ACLT2T_09355 [Bilophila wadsworthia]
MVGSASACILMQGHSLLPLAKGDVEKVREFAIAGYFRYSWSISPGLVLHPLVEG